MTTDLKRRKRRDVTTAPVDKPGRQDWSTWPRYEAATLGLRNYWYPVLWSRSLRNEKPKAVRVLGEDIMLVRTGGKVSALHDRCPHRGVRLSHPMATQEFPGTWSCCYHGWTFDLQTGALVAAITDGPDSKVCGRVSVRTYPVEERAGLVWLYVGDDEPPPVESDIPDELLSDRTLVVGKRTVRDGDWRFGAENGFDHGHAKYLHRRTLWTFFRQMSAHSLADTVDQDPWLTQIKSEFSYQSEYPGLGTWPKKMKKITYKFPPAVVSIRLPGTLRVKYRTWNHYEWWFPQDSERHIYVQVIATRQNVLRRALFALWYYTWVRWVFHGIFNGEDALMVDVMDAPPEMLYRPDRNLLDWRKHIEDRARPQPTDSTATARPVSVATRRTPDIGQGDA